MADTVLLEVRDGVARVTLNRPNEANAITLELARDLQDVATAVDQDPAARVVLLSGNGSRFCGGGDLGGFRAAGDDLPRHLRSLMPALHTAIGTLVRGDAPIVAAVHGSAAGAGMGLVAMSDIVVAAESTKFVMAYTQVGLTPDGSSTWFLPRLIGLKRSLELALTNRVLSAQEALDLGLVTRVVPDDDVQAEAEAVATSLASGPTVAFGIARRLLLTSTEDTFETHLAREADGIVQVSATHDAREGIAAFLEKRTPTFTGE